MHGWGDYSQRYVKQFSALIPQLLSHAISVYALDMWGNGRSPGARGATDINDAIRDHLAARVLLRKQSLPVFVLGHSVGGLVTVSSTLNDSSDVRGMILIAPALSWNVSGFMRSLARVVSVFAPTRAVPVPASDPLLQSSDTVFLRQLAEDPLYHHGAITWITAATGATVAHRNLTRYAGLSVPVLVVNGSQDQVTTPAAARSFMEKVQSPDRTLRIIDGGRHSLLDDPPSSTQALDAILEWLDRRLP
jgi:alpha-beta hydrolase superfamily lysophospholipase